MNKSPIYEILIEIINASIKNNKINSEVIGKLTNENLEKVYKLLAFHDLGHILYNVVNNNQINISETARKALENSYIKATIRKESLALEHKKITSILEENKIKYITLKGESLQALYPNNFIRPSCDVDILVEKKHLKKATKLIKEKCEARKVERNYHDITITTSNNILIELHFSLKENDEKLDKITANPFENAKKENGNNYEYKLNNEFLFSYLLSHLAYHLTHGGSGIKPFIDLYLLKNAVKIDEKKLYFYLKKGNLEKFYQKISYFISVWFDGAEHNEFTLLLQDYVLSGGVYGTAEQKNAVNSVKNSGKENKLIKKIFIPYKTLKEYYPILNKVAVFYPIFIVVRLVKALFDRDRVKRAKKEIKVGYNSDKKQKVEKLLKELNI